MEENTIWGRFERMVLEHPRDPAIIENDRVLSFQDLAEMARSIACSFPEDLKSVGIVMDHGAEMIASMLAVLRCGAMYVPAEPTFPRGRIRRMMREARVDFVLTNREYATKLERLPLRFIEDLDLAATCARQATASPGDPAYVLYTSGTTGRPKGICVTNANVCHYVRAFENEFHAGPGDIMMQNSVCTFDIFVEEVFASLLNGAALAIPSKTDTEDVRAILKFADRHGVSIISGFPYLVADINSAGDVPAALRLVISGGDILHAAQADKLLDKVTVYNTYGPSETTVCASYYRCNDGEVLEDGTYPIGRPVLGTQICILNASGGAAQPGETGEICICGDGVSQGYIGEHDEENKAFETLPDGHRRYRSGDLGYLLPDGNIAFVKRKDSQVMIRGKRVEVLEVESALYQCEGVEQAVVRAFVDETGQPYLAAYVVPSDEDVTLSSLTQQLEENLPAFMIPEFFVKLTEMPLTPNGKPDVERLPIVLKAS